MEGFAAAADKHGYAITLTKVDGHPYTLESASSRMSALPVDGMVVIMNRMPADFGTFEPLPGMQTVLVTMLERYDDSAMPPSQPQRTPEPVP